jgi:hypothetical protein
MSAGDQGMEEPVAKLAAELCSELNGRTEEIVDASLRQKVEALAQTLHHRTNSASFNDIRRNIAYSESDGDIDGEYNGEQMWSSLTKKRLLKVMNDLKIPLSWGTYLLQRLDEPGTVCGRPLTGLCPSERHMTVRLGSRTYAASSDSGSGSSGAERYYSQANFLLENWTNLSTEVKSYFRAGNNAEGDWFKEKLGHLRDNTEIKREIESNPSKVTVEFIQNIVAQGNTRRKELRRKNREQKKRAENKLNEGAAQPSQSSDER